MKMLDREINPQQHEIIPSMLTKRGAEYVRREYFKDGQRIFFSPLDFALNGPQVTLGAKTVISREHRGSTCTLTVLDKHHDGDDPTPCYVTVGIKWTVHGGVFEEGLADIITKDCKLVREHFGFLNYQVKGNTYFAISPHFWREKALYKNPQLPLNRISAGVALTTGINAHSLVSDDKYV
jgi:hypothetical protein